MAKRIIPPKTKQSALIISNPPLTIKDLIFLFVLLLILALIWMTSFGLFVRLFLIGAIGAVGSALVFTKVNENSAYVFFFSMIGFLLRKKRIESFELKETLGFEINDCFVSIRNARGYKLNSIVIEINGVNFGILTEREQNYLIELLAILFQRTQNGKIVKLDKALNFDTYLEQIKKRKAYFEEKFDKKIEELKAKLSSSSPQNVIGIKKEIENLQKEKAASPYLDILNNQEVHLDYFNSEEPKLVETFYLVLYHSNEQDLLIVANDAINRLNNASLESFILEKQELKEFYELFYDQKYDKEDNLTIPAIEENAKKLMIGNEEYKIATLGKLSMFCANAWLSALTSIQNTKVVISFSGHADVNKVKKNIDRSILELKSRMEEKNITESIRNQLDYDIASYLNLLTDIQFNGDSVLTFSLFILYPAHEQKRVEETFKDSTIHINRLMFKQLPAFLEMMPYSLISNSINEAVKDIQAVSLASGYPFVSKKFLDKRGQYTGFSQSAIFFDQFASWREKSKIRTNANMCIIGRPGGGKSYFLKKSVMQELLNGTRIFVLDPENEYIHLSKMLGGNYLDVGGLSKGIINPFHVFALPQIDEIDIEDQSEEAQGNVTNHISFLQEFFNTVIPNLKPDYRDLLNNEIVLLYENFGISDFTAVEELPASKFPTFDDLYKQVKESLELEDNTERRHTFYLDGLLRIELALRSFIGSGAYAKIWNGYTSLNLNNDFTVFDFQKLLSSGNKIVSSGQMFLLLRYLMQEVIKNKINNDTLGIDKNIMIVIDEAHVFIDPNNPAALKFMKDVGKRIRKYGGALTVATQNIADFIGQAAEVKSAATAVLNNCQYSLVFGLAPDDMNSFQELFRSYQGGLTENELDFISSAEQGDALFIITPKIRLQTRIHVLEGEEKYIVKPD
ncbi:MAG: ATP-binding protein [Erysipelotrichales bacterium]|nr:ATP-binding protein [Erysipelotrichales bacterium]